MSESSVSAVPSIEQTIGDVLRNGGYGAYASQPVVAEIVRALMAREQVLTGAPGTVASAQAFNAAGAGQDLNVEERLLLIQQRLDDLTSFARQNGYSG